MKGLPVFGKSEILGNYALAFNRNFSQKWNLKHRSEIQAWHRSHAASRAQPELDNGRPWRSWDGGEPLLYNSAKETMSCETLP